MQGMKIVIFGLTVSSSWGNGHATLWRGLCRALAERGHQVIFFERDVPYYAGSRDLWELPGGGTLVLYSEFADVRWHALNALQDADLAMTTSYCPDGIAAAELLLNSTAAIKAFYDLDTPVTLSALRQGEPLPYLPPQGLGDFDLVLSYTGGRALTELREKLHSRRVEPLYGSVDPATHFPVAACEEFRADLSYLGTYSADRQPALQELFLEPARNQPNWRFLIGGTQYPHDFPWLPNLFFVRHLPPQLHPAFFCSLRATLNVTRRAMAEYGYCPSGRLFEAAACGAPIFSDMWQGLDSFFTPGTEIIPVSTAAEVQNALSLTDAELNRLAAAARERTLSEHTAACRVRQLEAICTATPTLQMAN